MMRTYYTIFVVMSVLLIATGCKQTPKEPEVRMDNEAIQEVSSEKKERIEVDLINQEGISIGSATLHEDKAGVRIDVEANHLAAGLHGFHIHEKGICEPPSFESAGGHFNPDHKKHGFDNPEGPHAGDLENLEVRADGTVEQQFLNNRVTLKEGAPNSLFSEEGTTLMIHADPDDYKTDPAGNSGERIVCGVISEGKK